MKTHILGIFESMNTKQELEIKNSLLYRKDYDLMTTFGQVFHSLLSRNQAQIISELTVDLVVSAEIILKMFDKSRRRVLK